MNYTFTSAAIQRLLGERVVMAVERLMGLILSVRLHHFLIYRAKHA